MKQYEFDFIVLKEYQATDALNCPARGFMKIGYACKTVGVPNTEMKSCILKNVSDSKLMDLITHNLDSLNNIIDYNISQGIPLFRISSDLIPFASHPVNSLPWHEIFAQPLADLGKKILASRMRVSMHPGQYTVLNSPDNEVTSRAIKDLHYHCQVLDALGVGPEHKVILHIGGIYQNKRLSAERFLCNFKHLDKRVRSRLVVENDDKAYNIEEVLDIGVKLGVPVVFDSLHHEINPSPAPRSQADWITVCQKTWQKEDGIPKIHYSQQDPAKKPGSHSRSIGIGQFIQFYQSIPKENIDIMLEVKDKNLSAVKIINCLCGDRDIKTLEAEWSRYKYTILECSPQAYKELRQLLCDKSQYPAMEFYTLLENALNSPREAGNCINAAQHVWGYFKNRATTAEREKFMALLQAYKLSRGTLAAVKGYLRKLTVEYRQSYLFDSYYFEL